MKIALLGNKTSVEDLTGGDSRCKTVITLNVATIAFYMLGFFFTLFLCNGLHTLLKPLSQPRIISESIVGLFLSNLPFIRDQIRSQEVNKTLSYLADVGMICHMFVLGLEIDHHILLQPSVREAKVAYAGMLSTFILALLVTPLLQIPNIWSIKFTLTLSLILSGTASPLLTRMITDLKIGKSDIGRFVVSAGIQSDLVSTLLLALGFIIFDPISGYKTRSPPDILRMFSAVVIETVIAAKVSPTFMTWVNNENPEGKPMKGSHLVLSTAYVVLVCGSSPVIADFNSMLSAFLAGIFMPREGRISKMMITKVNYFVSCIFYPLFFFWMGSEGELKNFGAGHIGTWARLFFLFVTATVGKLVGTAVSGVMLGFHWPESIAIALLLNIKGHFHVYLAIIAAKSQITTISTSMAMIFATFLTIIYTPVVVANIIERARKRSPTQRMALQWLNPLNELRILLCLHGPRNLPSAINFMEISRGPIDPGILVYVTDMLELTDKIASTLAHSQGINDASTVTDRGVMDMRDQITNRVQAYTDEDGKGIGVRRILALATMNSMHQDICVLADELLVSLIILPFHKDQQTDGRLSPGNSGFRHVNRKIFRHAPCSVGILVDRGLGTNKISKSQVSLDAAVIFIGGKDDREALSYAGRVARHPGVKLTVIRFLLDSNSDSVSSRVGVRTRVNTPQQEEEVKLDDECFAEFYDKHVAGGGHVAYMEKYLVNSGQTFSTLRSLEGQYGLFIVGRGGRVNSVLTVGMNDWEECPELGPIGDILSTSEFSVTASVLIIQQHDLKGELDGLDDEFSIM